MFEFTLKTLWACDSIHTKYEKLKKTARRKNEKRRIETVAVVMVFRSIYQIY